MIGSYSLFRHISSPFWLRRASLKVVIIYLNIPPLQRFVKASSRLIAHKNKGDVSSIHLLAITEKIETSPLFYALFLHFYRSQLNGLLRAFKLLNIGNDTVDLCHQSALFIGRKALAPVKRIEFIRKIFDTIIQFPYVGLK